MTTLQMLSFFIAPVSAVLFALLAFYVVDRNQRRKPRDR
ncbi:hypothetical protein SAMN05428967_2619 [Phyllobacterium sp. YR620]|nr:hypothetical protein SAMN05428967_2619 [Phyllobacterium sp. YR620]SFI47760.1 hypothetical protein SAMN04515648_0040 [Phyllobacterium sp. CL33Tsu]